MLRRVASDTFAERAAVVSKAAAIMRANVDEFARPVTLEKGKLIAQSRGEVLLSADILDYYAENAARFLAPQRLEARLDAAEILTDILPNNPAYREKFFGPVGLFFRVKNEDDAVGLANDSEFDLGGAVFTQDEARGKRVVSRIDTGMMFVNHPTWTTPDLPFGGIKNSGYGHELSCLGIQELVNKKLVRVSAIDSPA